MARFAGVSARFTSIPSAASTVMPASRTADGSSSPMSGPAACQKRPSITSAGTGSRQSVTTFPVGTCHSRMNGMSASSPARRASASQYDASGIRAIAIISRMTSGYDMIRRRCRGFSRPCCDRRAHDRLDHAVAEVALQLAQPHQVRQPRVRQHRPVPADHRGRGHHRAAEHRQLARRRHRIPRRDRPPLNPQASGPHHDRPRRSPGDREPRSPACINDGRQIRTHKGLL